MAWNHLTDRLTPEELGAIMAFMLAILRILGEKEDKKFTLRRVYRMFIEGLTCSALTIAAIPVVGAFGLDPQINVAVGTFIGYVGSQTIRLAAVSFLNKKVK